MTAPVLSRAERQARRLVISNLRGCGYTGTGFDGITGASFDEQAEQAFLRAEADCRGELTNDDGRRRSIDPRSLFTGTDAHARRWASEELIEWWETNGRPTRDEYRQDLIRSAVVELDAAGELDEDEDEDTMTVTTVAAAGAETAAAAPVKMSATAEHGARLLDEVCAMLDRFCVFPSDAQRDAAALWIVSTHARDYDQMMVWNAHGRLGLLSITPNSGKTTALTVVAHLAYGDDPTLEVSPSARGMLQAINEEHTPLFIDNLDTWWKRNASSNDAKSIVVAGYKYGARKRILNSKANLYEALAVSANDANLRNNPDMTDVMSRLIVVHMRQKRPDQVVTTWDGRIHDRDARQLRLALTSWGQRAANDLAMAWPTPPEGLTDGRQIEIWTPILAVGEACGPEWTARARTACRALALSDAEALDDEPVQSPTDMLLAALAEVLDPREAKVSTRELVGRLAGSSYRWMAGVPLKPASMELSARLRPLGVGPVPFWDPERGSVQGYALDDLKPLLPALVGDLVPEAEEDPELLPL